VNANDDPTVNGGGVPGIHIQVINVTLVEEAYAYIHAEVQVHTGAMKNGTLPNGSFAQRGSYSTMVDD
jgi:hypothetical protein